MTSRNIHKYLGLILLLPFIGWIVTGVVFLFKPGYADAYGKLTVKTYPIESAIQVPGLSGFEEIRFLKTVLGTHLLVRVGNDWKHRSIEGFNVIEEPGREALVSLVNDAIAVNPDRYGVVVNVDGDTFYTSTDVAVTLDWNTLSLRQIGPDTRLIKTLYRIHYLEWFENPLANRLLGIGGLLALLILLIYGVILYWRGRQHERG